MDAQRQQALERLQTANNILVTVSRDPSVDQLSAAIGITLLLNKLGKHATAVYSGKTPSTIEFLQPEKTIEKNTDSLRDFIIALDKSKADKLRYKVEDQMVKIFITPYRTSISDKDLEYSQGDFNVEVVLALGVVRQQDLDQAITTHGRILHDATVIGVTTQAGEEALGGINWVDTTASSLSEMMTHLGLALDSSVLDEQTATALLTGIVAETERFSNQKTTSETMQASAKLMEAGANQQLVASELETAPALNAHAADDNDSSHETGAAGTGDSAPADGSLVIEHEPGELLPETTQNDEVELPEPEEQTEVEQIDIDYDGEIKSDAPAATATDGESTLKGSSRLVLQPPTLGGKLTANSQPEMLDPSVDPLSSSSTGPLLSHTPALTTENEASAAPNEPPTADIEAKPSVQNNTTANPQDTLTDIEKLVSSPHQAPQTASPDQSSVSPPTSQASVEPEAPVAELTQASSEPSAAPEVPPSDVNTARDAVDQAVNSVSNPLEPVQSLNAMPVNLDLGDIPAVNTSPASAFADPSSNIPPEAQADAPHDSSTDNSQMHVASDPDLPPGLITNEPIDETAAPTSNPTSSPAVMSPQGPPPQVPPPMMPPNFDSPQNNSNAA